MMTPEQLAALMAEGKAPVVVDVRTPEKYAAGHLPGALNIPVEELEERAAEWNRGGPVVFY